MAKNYRDKNIQKIKSILEPSEGPETYVTSRGLEITLLPLPPYLIQMTTSSVEIPTPPTYTIKIEGGGEETHEHDEQSIRESSDEEKAQWEKYRAALREANAKVADTLLTVVLMEGVRVEIPDKERWLKRQKLMGLEVPDDEDEQELLFKKTQVIGSGRDIEVIMQRTISLGGITPEELKTVKDSFQGSMESDA